MLFNELIVDNFAGWGGASLGIQWATGREIDIAINHNPIAIAMHQVNHPSTKHYCESVWDIDPREAVNGLPVALAWFSPDCKHFSKAKGKQPVSKNIRGLAWVCTRWAATVKPRVIMLENVEEFKTWGPVIDGKPCPKQKGKTFNSFTKTLENLGYKVEFKELKACDYGAPTIRKRLFMIARRDNAPIIWPSPTHGAKGSGLQPYKTVADCIDWSIPCKSIFNRKKPLAEKTMQRIAKGLEKFVFCDDPFIVPEKAAAIPFVTEFANASNQRNMPANEPCRTICAEVKGGHFGLVTSHVIKMRNGNFGHRTDEPAHTITAGGFHLGEVRAFILKYYGTNVGHSCNQPLQTITTKHRFGIVYVKGEAYQIIDIAMRMFEPHELALMQGFDESYVLDYDAEGNYMSKAKQVNGIGNSVSPWVPKAMVESNLPELCHIAAVA